MAASFALKRSWCFPPTFLFCSELQAQCPSLRQKSLEQISAEISVQTAHHVSSQLRKSSRAKRVQYAAPNQSRCIYMLRSQDLTFTAVNSETA